MKLLVSAAVLADARDDDFCFVPDGELVYEQGITCSSFDRAMQCGCGRSLSGTATPKATTTMRVVDEKVDDAYLMRLALRVAKKTGWGPRYVLQGMDLMREAAEQFPVGTLVRARISRETGEFVYESDEKGS